MLSLIGIFIFAFAEFLYDYSAVGESANWSIFYFASTYLAMVLISFDLLFKDNSKTIRLVGASFGIFFLVLMVGELVFINVPFDEYIVGVNDSKLRILTYGLIAIALIFITYTAWVKRLSKR